MAFPKLFKTQPKDFPVKDNQLGALPKDVVFCSRCVTSNQRPRITFDENNVCSACNFAEKKAKIVWAEREAALVELLDQYRSSTGKYDVIVPSSGGKDSGYVAHMLRTRYGMHPLTVTWAPFIYTDIGRKNFDGMVHAGFDNVCFTTNGIIHRKLARIALECNGDAWDPFAYGQKAFAFQMAVKFNIPLIFYGENGEVEYGGDSKYENRPYEDVRDWSDLYFKGNSIQAMVDIGLETGVFTKNEVANYDFSIYTTPDLDTLGKLGAQQHWFSFYSEWIPQENYYYCSEHTNFEANEERSEGTYTKYASLDDQTDGFHFWFGYLKFGMGRTTRDASMEVRSNHISREEAVALVHKYDGEFPQKYFPAFLEYLDLSEDRFWEIADKFRTPHLWDKVNGEWKLKYLVENI